MFALELSPALLGQKVASLVTETPRLRMVDETLIGNGELEACRTGSNAKVVLFAVASRESVLVEVSNCPHDLTSNQQAKAVEECDSRKSSFGRPVNQLAIFVDIEASGKIIDRPASILVDPLRNGLPAGRI